MQLSRVLVALALLAFVTEADSKDAAKKAEKEEMKAEKKKEKRAKHLLKDERREREGENTEHHEIREQPGFIQPSFGDYHACVEYLNREIASKEFEQRKHAMKDEERIAKGEIPEHAAEASITKNYEDDPKFNVERICGPKPSIDYAATPNIGSVTGGWATPLLLVLFVGSFAFRSYSAQREARLIQVEETPYTNIV